MPAGTPAEASATTDLPVASEPGVSFRPVARDELVSSGRIIEAEAADDNAQPASNFVGVSDAGQASGGAVSSNSLMSPLVAQLPTRAPSEVTSPMPSYMPAGTVTGSLMLPSEVAPVLSGDPSPSSGTMP